jgi:vacuolar-type H+-ATPase subunit C/Vma6
VQATVTLASAFLVTLVLQKRTGDHFKKKELLIKQCEHILDLLAELEETEFPKNLVEVNFRIKKIRLRCRTIKSCAEKSAFSKAICDSLEFATSISKLRKLATKTPVSTMLEHVPGKQYGTIVENGMVSLGEQTKLQFEKAIEDMRNDLIVVQLAITQS